MNSKPTVSILIPERNEEKYIAACLDSLLEGTYPLDDLEILVIDGSSEDKTKEIVHDYIKKYPQIKWLDNPGKIVPKALNIGKANAQGEYLVRIDAHTEYAKDYVEQCVRLLKENKADNVGGAMRPKGSNWFSKSVAAATISPFGIGGGNFHFEEAQGYVDTVYLGAFKKTVFEKVGGFDEELVRNQDDEFNLRMRKEGLKIWLDPSVKSWYVPRDSIQKLWSQYYQYGFWKIRVAQKHGQIVSLRSMIPLIMVLGALVLFTTGFFEVHAWCALGTLALLHVCCSLLFGLKPASQISWSVWPLLPVTFATLHLSYGLGSLVGIFHFLVMKKGSS